MKNLKEIILEKLKVNSKTKINTDFYINFNYDDCKFYKSDLNKIIKFIKKLSILPEEVVLSDGGHTIVLKYNHLSKSNEFVRIYFISKMKEYQIGFRKTLFDNVILYPSSNIYYNIDECFDCINEHWKDWKKYIKKNENT